MSAEVRVKAEWVGWRDIYTVLARSMPAFASADRAWVNAMKATERKTDVKAAQRGYRALGKSGSLAMAMRAYRWKRHERGPRHFVVHTGPKRSVLRALFRYLNFWNKPIKPYTLQYGLRHAHLVEFGHKPGHRKGRVSLRTAMTRLLGLGRAPGRKVGARHILAHARASQRSRIPKILLQEIQPAAAREISRVMKRRTKTKVL